MALILPRKNERREEYETTGREKINRRSEMERIMEERIEMFINDSISDITNNDKNSLEVKIARFYIRLFNSLENSQIDMSLKEISGRIYWSLLEVIVKKRNSVMLKWIIREMCLNNIVDMNEKVMKEEAEIDFSNDISEDGDDYDPWEESSEDEDDYDSWEESSEDEDDYDSWEDFSEEENDEDDTWDRFQEEMERMGY